MGIKIREMQTSEAKLLQKNGSKVFFRSLEAPFMTKPKTAFVAELDNAVVGAFIYTISNYGGKKIGYCDYLYVDADHTGKGIASKLNSKGIDYLWSQGCDYIAACVRDDNVGSWAAFEKHGFVRAKILQMIKSIGLGAFLTSSISNFYWMSYSSDYFIAARPNSNPPTSAYKKEASLWQVPLHLLMNFFLLLSPIIASMVLSNVDALQFFTDSFVSFGISALAVLGGVIVFGFLGTLFSRRKWSYRMATGGMMLSIPLSIWAFVPISGNWYPKKYENTAKFRLDMAITSILPWLFLLGLRILFGMDILADDLDFLDIRLILGITDVLLVMRCIPLFIVNQGGSRIFKFSKILWLVMAALSVVAVFFW